MQQIVFTPLDAELCTLEPIEAGARIVQAYETEIESCKTLGDLRNVLNVMLRHTYTYQKATGRVIDRGVVLGDTGAIKSQYRTPLAGICRPLQSSTYASDGVRGLYVRSGGRYVDVDDDLRSTDRRVRNAIGESAA